MTATEAQVAAAMEALGSHAIDSRVAPHPDGTGIGCRCGLLLDNRSAFIDHRTRAVADAVVAAGPDPANVAAEALREAAADLDWMRPDKSPCDNPEACCGSEASCDAMQPSVPFCLWCGRDDADRHERTSA